MTYTVLITRPTHQADNISQLMISAGGSVFHLPVFEIQSLLFSPINPDKFDYFIFLSANAVVNFFLYAAKNNFYTTKIIAIGAATKRALLDIGINNILCPTEFNSEGILNMPDLQYILKKQFAIVCGENPKSLLKKILLQRGAIIYEVFCYRRQLCVYDMEKIFPQLIAKKIDSVVCTSTESLLHLAELFKIPDHHAWLLQKTLCVINGSMSDLAIKMGFQSVIVAENATDEAVMRAHLDYFA